MPAPCQEAPSLVTNIDDAFPLSDHADHGDLIEHVEETRAKRVFTVHGFTEEFAGDLRALGIDALALGGGNQRGCTVIRIIIFN